MRRCEYCRSPATHTTNVYEVEHILPEARGGTDAMDNLAFSCSGCNTYKQTVVSAVDPVTQLQTPLFNPRLQIWDDHFAWSDDGVRAVGITPVGRVTVQQLRMNREPETESQSKNGRN